MMKKNVKWKNLGSNRLILTFLRNTFTTIMVCLCVGLYFNFDTADSFHWDFTLTLKQIVLCILFAALINASVNRKRIYQTVVKIEDLMEDYNGLLDEKGLTGSARYMPDIALEEAFEYLIRQQELTAEREHLEEKERQRIESCIYKRQMEPEFLCDTLDSLEKSAKAGGQDEIAELAGRLSRLTRKTFSREDTLQMLEKEFEDTEDYLKIWQFRLGKGFTYSCSANDRILKQRKIPRMILIPLVENAMIHGLLPKGGEGNIYIDAYEAEERMVLCVTDNGAGMGEKQVQALNKALEFEPAVCELSDERAHGAALLHLNRRIKLHYGDKYGIQVQSIPDVRTQAEVVLPPICTSWE